MAWKWWASNNGNFRTKGLSEMMRIRQFKLINLLDLQTKEIFVVRKYRFPRFYEKNVQFSRFSRHPFQMFGYSWFSSNPEYLNRFFDWEEHVSFMDHPRNSCKVNHGHKSCRYLKVWWWWRAGRGGRRGEGVVIVVERILCHYSTLRLLVNCLCARGMLPMLDWVKQKHTTKRLSFFEHVSFEHNAVKSHSLLMILVRKCNNNHLQITNWKQRRWPARVQPEFIGEKANSYLQQTAMCVT